MPGVSSANPAHLDNWAVVSRALDGDLSRRQSTLAGLHDQFVAGSRWGHFDASSLIAGMRTYVGCNETDAQWTTTIAAQFRRADSRPGVVTDLPDRVIAAGLRAAGLTGSRQSVTFDDAIAWGLPPTSGYANDPVNTASGNFVEAETDLECTGLLSALRFNRTYNSRSDRVGPFGLGWGSWASTRLRAAPDGAHWEAPDGQRALIPLSSDGTRYRRVAGIPGLVVAGGPGLVLRWFGGRRWEFDDAGLLVLAEDGPGTQVRFRYVDAKLVELAHEGGKRLDVRWDGERIVALECSDGRRVDYRYDDAGALVEVDGPGGRRRYELDAQGRVLAVLDADGVVELRNTYDADGRVLGQVSPHGRRTRMRYLPGGVTIVDDQDGGPVNTYLHDERGRLVGVIDGHGAELTKEYDLWGNPTVVTDRLGAVTLREWDDRTRLIRQVSPGGAVFTFAYDDADRVVEIAVSIGGSAAGFAGATVGYRYDGAERIPAEIVDPEGGVTRLAVAGGLVRRLIDPDGVEVRFGYDRDACVTSVTDADGHATTIERDAAGRITATVSPTGRRTELACDRSGRVVERREPGGAVWRFGYTAAGRLASVTDPTGARTEVRHGASGEAEQIVDPLGHVTTRRFDTLGNLAGVVAADGAKWELSHDALCRLVGVHDPAGGSWLREHDAGGNLTGSIDPAGARRAVTVDHVGRITKIDDGVTWSEFEYDELGRVRARRRPDGSEHRIDYDRCGRRVIVTDALGGVSRFAYSPAGRLTRLTSPLGHTVDMEYDRTGRLTAEIDPRGRRREYRYDAEGQVTRVSASGQAWYFDYDAAGRLASHREPHGGTTAYGYDAVGRPTQVTDPTGGVVRFSYDGRGDLVQAGDARGGVSRYGYNARGWLTTASDPLGEVVERGYDEVGRPVSATDQLGRTTRWEYEPAGRLVRSLDAAGNQVRWSYDVSGRLAFCRVGDSEPVTVQRDSLGRIVVITEPGLSHQLTWDPLGRLTAKRSGDLQLMWEYDADGRRIAASYPDGLRATFTRDPADGLTTASHPLLGTVRLTRDEDGRVIGLDTPGGSQAWSYRDGQLVGHTVEHDGRRQLTELERDAAGRVVTETRDGVLRRYHYDIAGQLVGVDSSDGNRSYGYDAAGRLISETGPDGPVSCRYDAAGQLRERRRGTEVTEYGYDAAGRRVSETGPGYVRSYSWSPLGQLAAIHRQGANGESVTRLTVDAFGDLARVDGVALAWDPTCAIPRVRWVGDTTILGDDQQPWATTGPSGAVTWLDTDWQHSVGQRGVGQRGVGQRGVGQRGVGQRGVGQGRDPWGAVAAAGVGLGWRGELTVDGLTWLRNRVYDPSTRGFLSPDPLPPVPGNPVAAYPYHYANNDPVNLVDPFGLRPMTDADLAAYRDAHHGFLSDAADWTSHHWGEIAAGLVVAGGVALLFVPGAEVIGVGILMGAGGNAFGQYAAKGEVEWDKVAFKGLAGGLGGAAGSAVAGSSALLSVAAQGGVRVLAPYAAGGATSAFTSSTLGEVDDVTSGKSFDLDAILFKMVAGGAFGAGGGTFPASGAANAEVLRQVTSSSGSVWAETVKQFHDAGRPLEPVPLVPLGPSR